jgi:hypothetical protein
MEGLLLLAVVGLMITTILLATLVFLTSRSLTRPNRVSPRVPTQAPTLWRWSFGAAARLHRRLQRVAILARTARTAAGPTGVSVGDLATDLERQAVALDDQIVLASRFATGHRVRRLFELEQQVSSLEQLGLRLTVIAGHVSSNSADTLIPLQERVTALEHALVEIRQIEAAALGEARAAGRVQPYDR